MQLAFIIFIFKIAEIEEKNGEEKTLINKEYQNLLVAMLNKIKTPNKRFKHFFYSETFLNSSMTYMTKSNEHFNISRKLISKNENLIKSEK